MTKLVDPQALVTAYAINTYSSTIFQTSVQVFNAYDRTKPEYFEYLALLKDSISKLKPLCDTLTTYIPEDK